MNTDRSGNDLRSALPAALVVLVGLVVSSLAASTAEAIPAFARKYGTSCQTCHIAYPKLNAFGQAFRLRGYQMPGETEGQIKQPDVPLGAPAYRKVWPDTVWPGAVPESLPISFAAQFLIQNSSVVEEGADHGAVREVVHNDFVFPSEAELIVGGTAGDHVAYFGEIEFEREAEHGGFEDSVTVGHLDMRFMRPIADSTAFNVKIGAFQPELVSTFDHARRLTLANYDSMFAVDTIKRGGAETVGVGGHHGGGGVALPAVTRGIEFFGIAAHRFQWSAGFVNGLEPGDGAFDANSNKDMFARLAYKWGGLAPDGSNADTYAGSEKNWRETSFQLGVFAYEGDGENFFAEDDHHGEPVLVEDRDFSRYGIDFNFFFKDLNIFGAWVTGSDDLQVWNVDEHGEPADAEEHGTGDFDYDAWFIEADVVLGIPWLHGAFRYETVDLPGTDEEWERATASLTGLIRANVKATLEYTRDLNQSDNYELLLGFSIAF